MRILRMVIGIISIILFFLVSFQSCVAGVGNALEGSGESSGTAGFMLALFMLIAGIIGIAGQKSKGATITAMIFYLIGGIIGIANVGSYSDLQVWSILTFIFAGLYFISLFFGNKKKIAETT